MPAQKTILQLIAWPSCAHFECANYMPCQGTCKACRKRAIRVAHFVQVCLQRSASFVVVAFGYRLARGCGYPCASRQAKPQQQTKHFFCQHTSTKTATMSIVIQLRVQKTTSSALLTWSRWRCHTAQYNTWLLIKFMPKGVIISILIQLRVQTNINSAAEMVKLFSIPKRLFQFRNVIPTLEI